MSHLYLVSNDCCLPHLTRQLIQSEDFMNYKGTAHTDIYHLQYWHIFRQGAWNIDIKIIRWNQGLEVLLFSKQYVDISYYYCYHMLLASNRCLLSWNGSSGSIEMGINAQSDYIMYIGTIWEEKTAEPMTWY